MGEMPTLWTIAMILTEVRSTSQRMYWTITMTPTAVLWTVRPTPSPHGGGVAAATGGTSAEQAGHDDPNRGPIDRAANAVSGRASRGRERPPQSQDFSDALRAEGAI